MRIAPFLISASITAALVFSLNKKWGAVPPVGKFLSPQFGIWQNAEATDKDFAADLKIPGLKDKVEIYFDDRLVPHVFAQNDDDAYFVQGYLHAKFRLWQMEFQSKAAGGRLTEVLGTGKDSAILNSDRNMRRLGMVFAAKRSLEETEKDPVSKAVCDAYTAGVNAYIANMKESELPLEYKLLDYKPEKWENLKTMLFLKFMSLDLAGPEFGHPRRTVHRLPVPGGGIERRPARRVDAGTQVIADGGGMQDGVEPRGRDLPFQVSGEVVEGLVRDDGETRVGRVAVRKRFGV